MPPDEGFGSQPQNEQEVLLHVLGGRPVGQFASGILVAGLHVSRVDWTSILAGDSVNVSK